MPICLGYVLSTQGALVEAGLQEECKTATTYVKIIFEVKPDLLAWLVDATGEAVLPARSPAGGGGDVVDAGWIVAAPRRGLPVLFGDCGRLIAVIPFGWEPPGGPTRSRRWDSEDTSAWRLLWEFWMAFNAWMTSAIVAVSAVEGLAAMLWR
jgi:hypothetical protein